MNSRNICDIERYVDWLETVLIPDLNESELTATAFDFEQCVKIIKDNVLNNTMAPTFGDKNDPLI